MFTNMNITNWTWFKTQAVFDSKNANLLAIAVFNLYYEPCDNSVAQLGNAGTKISQLLPFLHSGLNQDYTAWIYKINSFLTYINFKKGLKIWLIQYIMINVVLFTYSRYS